MAIRVKIEKGEAHIIISREKNPKVTEKGNVVEFTTHGNKSVEVDGKQYTIGVNMYRSED